MPTPLARLLPLATVEVAGLGAALASRAAAVERDTGDPPRVALDAVVVDDTGRPEVTDAPHGEPVAVFVASLLPRDDPESWTSLHTRLTRAGSDAAAVAIRAACASSTTLDELASRLAAVPGARLPAPAGRRAHARRAARVPGGRALPALGVTLVLAALLLAASTWSPARGEPPSATPEPTAPSAPPVDDEPVADVPTMRPCAVPTGTAADVDGDGCEEPVTVEGTRVSAGGATFEVGRAGDVAVLGDWTCAGAATLAVLRPSTGQVWLFDGWAGDDEAVARPLVRRPGTVAIEARRCGRVTLVDAAGRRDDVEVGS